MKLSDQQKQEKRQLLIHHVDEKYPDTHLDFRNETNDLRIDVRWDGCIHIENFCNGSTVDNLVDSDHRDYMHICDLKEFIAQLQEAYDRAKEKGFEV